MKVIQLTAFLLSLLPAVYAQPVNAWIRINQLGYAPEGSKAAVLGSKISVSAGNFQLVDARTGQVVFNGASGRSFGSYGPFMDTYRLDFSSFSRKGKYFIRSGETVSPVFPIDDNVYDGTADFCLRYMRQQRSGFNPFLRDSCHTHDGYTLYAPVPDSTYIDVVGGWHDASDYLQYSATSANATYTLLAAYRDFPAVFADEKQGNGLDGKNNISDVLDEARWGLEWLLKMHPEKNWMFNQLGDDRDHRGMRIPKEDTNFYGRGLERPVYFCTGEPQVRGKYMNNTTGVASTAGKFASAFALGSQLFFSIDRVFSNTLNAKSATAMALGIKKPGACQTASVVSPYIYAEDNWTDDMELAAAARFSNSVYRFRQSGRRKMPGRLSENNDSMLTAAFNYALQEPVTPWMGQDTAKHYQWYPFINIGHYELAKHLSGSRKDSITEYYREGIGKIWNKAKNNAFYRGIPYIWCSNNLTVNFAIQCYWYRQLTGDTRYRQLEQACFDWIFGCNPWGTSMVYGLPASGDSPADPHSAFTHLKNYPIDGGLVDGPVYTSIYSKLIGIKLYNDDEYAMLQSDLAVYHDDYGDYSTNEPTMDGTASLIYLLAAEQHQAKGGQNIKTSHGGIVRADSTAKAVALVFTADESGEGLPVIIRTLKKQNVHGSFFFTGRFYRNASFQPYIKELKKNGNYLGPHSNEHLLYCDWNKRDSLLVTKPRFIADMKANLQSMSVLDIDTEMVHYYIPPYEWWNDSIAAWSREMGLQVINFTPGIRTNADYTYPDMGVSYRSSKWILNALKKFNRTNASGLNGAIILVHAGTDKRRVDKLYNRLDDLIGFLKRKGYLLKRVDELRFWRAMSNKL